MMGLTHRQAEAYRHMVRAQCTGQRLTVRKLARLMGIVSNSRAHAVMEAVRERLGRDRIAAQIPRAPDGAPLRAIGYFEPVPSTKGQR